MKQVWFHPRRVNRGWFWQLLLLAAGLILLTAVLASCGKQKAAGKSAEDASDNSGYSLTTEPAQSLPGKVMQKGMEPQCQSNLTQLREFIMMYKSDNDGANPPNLRALSGAGSIMKCPVSRKEYQYNPATGTVHCTFPGHENL